MDQRLPLFDTVQNDTVANLEAEREALLDRVKGLPPHSHKGLVLADRLKAVTTLLLRAECETSF